MSQSHLKQFFTHDYEVLRPFIQHYCPTARLAIDPFAGEGHLLRLFDRTNARTLAIDIDPDVKPHIVAGRATGTGVGNAAGLALVQPT